MYLYIDIISSCNLRCPSCEMGDPGRFHGQRGLMTRDLLNKILDKAIAEIDVTGVGLYNWTEPLLHPDLPDLIKIVRAKNLSCSISTNLNILHDPDNLMRARPNQLRVSVSGFNQDIYCRGHANGDIETVKVNMARLADARAATDGDTVLECFFHRYNDNASELAPMAEYAHSLGFIFNSSMAYLTPVERIIRLHTDPKSASAIDNTILERLPIPLNKAIAATAKEKTNHCPLMTDQITLDVAGNVMLCCASSMKDTNKIGLYLENSFEDIKQRKTEHPLCRPCMALNLSSYFIGTSALTALENG